MLEGQKRVLPGHLVKGAGALMLRGELPQRMGSGISGRGGARERQGGWSVQGAARRPAHGSAVSAHSGVRLYLDPTGAD